MDDLTFIEQQFPVSKISKESYKERKAGASQTLTGLGKWWGRKPLILVRASIIGLLMPASNDPVKDRDIFLKILTMDDEGLWQRRSKSVPLKILAERASTGLKEAYLTEDANGKPKWQAKLSQADKNKVIRFVFERMSYDEKLNYCDRPEQIDGPSAETWQAINKHLGTQAKTLQELTDQLGRKRFGHTPRVGDAFCGGGSIPFEAARLGCEAYGSDLNPVAALLTWASIHLVGGGKQVQQQVQDAQQKAFEAADRQVTEWGIEHNDKGWRADAYLYCVEAKCPATGLWLPLAPSWVISEKYKVCAVLKKNAQQGNYDINIITGADHETFAKAKLGTIQNSRMICPETGESFPISQIRGDYKDENGKTVYGLRRWENEDVVPRPDDVFQERLYCVRWVETYRDTNAKGEKVEKIRRHYCRVDSSDIAREEKVLQLLQERFVNWQEQGFIPSREIEEGNETSRLFRERGWTHWHHLFNPRQLLVHGCLASNLKHKNVQITASYLLQQGRCANFDSRLSIWDSSRNEGKQTFSNQAFNTLFNIISRGQNYIFTFWESKYKPERNILDGVISVKDARSIDFNSGCWITDPPYADAINYHELTDFFLAWYEKHLKKAFPDWYADTKKALAVKGSGQDFKQSMVDIYSNLTHHMPDNGLQIVMFTHQDPSVWADLAMILWAAGLKVTAAWTIATETSSGLKQGNYVQGTVLLVLRKRLENEVVFLDEIYPEIEDEVKNQLNQMLALDDKDDPNFGDTDYQLAAYAAALRVLTHYGEIEGQDIRHELFRQRAKGEKSEFEKVIDRALEIACDHLVPNGFDTFHWKHLSANERLYLKGLELEKHGEARAGAYQELAKGFGVRDYKTLLAKTRANAVRFKSASEFKRQGLDGDGFAGSITRQLLFALHETVDKEDPKQGLIWLKTELPDYWNKRKLIREILNYLARLIHMPHLSHWEQDADAAERLSGVVENDHG